MIGKVLGNRYEVLEKIGEGGMAHVYKSKDQLLNRTVAVKVLKNEFSNDEEFLEKFKNEAQSAGSLNQQNIINIYDVGEDMGIPFIVMEYVDGENLKDLIHRLGPLPQDLMLNISRQIALALKEAHSNKIIHRDIKSQNIMITKHNTVKVADFGIAKAVSSSTITAVGSIMGSVHYFSPEQARGGYIDERSDIYSLGIVMYEMITGKLPFDGDTPVNIALKHIQQELTFSDSDNITSEIKDVIRKATQKSVDRRYSSAKELIEDIGYVMESKGSLNHGFTDETYHTQKIDMDDDYKILFTDVEEGSKHSESPKKEKSKEPKDPKYKKNLILTIVGALVASLVFVGAVFYFVGNPKIEKIETPQFIGLTLEEAEELALEFEIEILQDGEEVNNLYEPGQIAKQTPREGTKIEKGSIITIIISAEKIEEAQVPTVVNLDLNEAIEKIKAAGLNEIVEYKFDNTDANTVLEQTPRGGDSIEKGKAVRIVVSLGKEEENIELPNVVGKTEQEARTILKDFKIKVSYREDRNNSEGVVLSQTPSASQRLSAGSDVGIVVNRYEQPKEVSYTMIVSLPRESTSTRVQVKDASTDAFIYDRMINPQETDGILEVTVKGLPGEVKEYKIYLDGDYTKTYAEQRVQF